MKRKAQRYECPGCGRITTHAIGRSYWCSCNKSAPFRLSPLWISRAAREAADGLVDAINLAAPNAPGNEAGEGAAS